MSVVTNLARRSFLAAVAGAVVLAGLVAWVSSIGGPHGPEAGLASVLYVWMKAGPPALGYLLGAIGLGSLFAPLWKGARDGFALQCGVGLAVMLSLSHGLGVLGLLAGPKGLVLGGGVVLVGLVLLARQVMRVTRGGVKGSLPWSVLLGLPGLALLLTAACSSPGWLWGGTRADPVGEARGYDALEYHLQLPREWMIDGRIWPRDWNVYSFLPGYVESAFVHVGVLTRTGLVEGEGFGVVSCQMLAALMAVLAAFLVGRMVRQWVNDGVVAGLAGVLFLSTPWVLVTGSLAYNEMGMVSLMAAAVVAAGDRGLAGWRRGVLAGFLVGGACGCKPTALFLCAPIAGVFLILGSAKKSAVEPDGKSRGAWIELWMGLSCAAGAGFAAILPWMVRNWVACGNPVFPMATGLFGSGSWSVEQVVRYQAGHHFVGTVMERVILLLSSERGALHGQWGVLAVVAAAGLVVGLLKKRMRGIAAVLGVGMVLQVLAWMFLTHLQSRFLMPMAVTACGLVGVGLFVLLGGKKGPERQSLQRRGFVIGAGALVCVAQAGLSVGLYSAQADGKPNLLVLQSPWVLTGELERRALASDPSRVKQLAEESSPEVFVNVLVKPDAMVYLLGEARALYYTHPVLYNSTWDHWPLGEAMRKFPGNSSAWTRELWGRGVRLVLVNESELERLHASGWADPLVTVEAVRGWLKDEGRLVRSWPMSGGVGLYELKGPG